MVDFGDDDLKILHISDVHFGQPDERNEAARITQALIAAVHGQELVPDICIFSGDLAFSGKPEEYAVGAHWLSELLAPFPQAKLFIVPGNHDIVRKEANAILRQVFETSEKFASERNNLTTSLAHLSNFVRFHSELKNRFGDRLISDWTRPFGCRSNVRHGPRTIRFVGLNTALLSCYGDDEGKLAQDIVVLNELLSGKRQDGECVIAVGHHPFDWLTPWQG